MSVGIWKVNLTTTNMVEKHAGTGGKVLQLVHIAPCFVLVRKRDEKEIFRNYCFILAEMGNTWARGTGFFVLSTNVVFHMGCVIYTCGWFGVEQVSSSLQQLLPSSVTLH